MRGRWGWLGTWWFLGSVALLALNDHVLKDAFPGWWTGKLSDAVGPVAVATLLAVLVGRTPAAALTAVGFAALKTVPGVAELAAPVLGGVTRRDPTDLIGLLALPLAWWAMRPTPSATPRPAAAAVTSQLSLGRGTLRRAATLLGATAAVLAITATSPAERPSFVGLVTVESAIYTTESGYGGDQWARSDDGGLTWQAVPFDDVPLAARPSDDFPEGPPGEPPRSEACRSDGWCFAAAGETIDEKPPGGEWRRSFSFTDDERDLARYHGQDIRTWPFESVVAVATDEAENVVASVHSRGVVVLTPDGEWVERPVLGATPVDVSGSVAPLRIARWIALGAGPLGAALALVQAWRRAKRGVRTGGAPFLAVLVAFVFGTLCLVVWAVGTWQRWSPTLLVGVLAIPAGLTLWAPQVYLRRGRRRPDREE